MPVSSLLSQIVRLQSRTDFFTEWESVEINVGYGAEGFFIDSTGLQWSEQQGFGGWLGKQFPCR
jgi:hypothetical protein